MPKIAQAAAGMRMEPPVSVPTASGTTPAATAAPDPPLEPPGTWLRFQGFRVGPWYGLSVVGPKANSCVAVLPMMTAPAARSRRTQVASDSGI